MPIDDDDDDHTTAVNIPLALLKQGLGQVRLVVLRSGIASLVGKAYPIDGNELVLGRSQEAGIVIEDDGISRRHARVSREANGSYSVADLGSTNGTLLNGDRVDRATLHDGDKIQIGANTVLMFTLRDALEEQYANALYESATRDALTQALNRRALDDVLRTELAYTKRHHVPLSMLLIDIDRFKAVNDTYGHPAGDAVLRGVAKTLMTVIRTEDILARYGGEEFGVVLRGSDTAAAQRCGERCRSAVEAARYTHQASTLQVTISIGIATAFDGALDTPEALVDGADKCLYRAKSEGRNCIRAERR